MVIPNGPEILPSRSVSASVPGTTLPANVDEETVPSLVIRAEETVETNLLVSVNATVLTGPRLDESQTVGSSTAAIREDGVAHGLRIPVVLVRDDITEELSSDVDVDAIAIVTSGTEAARRDARLAMLAGLQEEAPVLPYTVRTILPLEVETTAGHTPEVLHTPAVRDGEVRIPVETTREASRGRDRVSETGLRLRPQDEAEAVASSDVGRPLGAEVVASVIRVKVDPADVLATGVLVDAVIGRSPLRLSVTIQATSLPETGLSLIVAPEVVLPVTDLTAGAGAEVDPVRGATVRGEDYRLTVWNVDSLGRTCLSRLLRAKNVNTSTHRKNHGNNLILTFVLYSGKWY